MTPEEEYRAYNKAVAAAAMDLTPMAKAALGVKLLASIEAPLEIRTQSVGFGERVLKLIKLAKEAVFHHHAGTLDERANVSN